MRSEEELAGKRSGSRKKAAIARPKRIAATPVQCHPSASADAPATSTANAIVTPSGAIPIAPPTRRARSPVRTAIAIRQTPAALVLGFVYQTVAGQPWHEGAKLTSDIFELMLLGFLAQLAEVRQPGAVFGDPLVGEFARLDVGEQILHRLARGSTDHALAARHIAVLGRVTDRVPHVGDAALVDEVD